jgi:hypothetical protein
MRAVPHGGRAGAELRGGVCRSPCQVYPDARFVMTHRDPTDVILAVADLYADIIGGFTDRVDRPYIGGLNVEHWSLGMERVAQFRDTHADARFYDIDFLTMQRDPMDAVHGLYQCWANRSARVLEPNEDMVDADGRGTRAQHSCRPNRICTRPRRDPALVRPVPSSRAAPDGSLRNQRTELVALYDN